MTDKVADKVADNINDTQIKILELIGNDPRITTESIAQSLGLSDSGVRKNIKQLRDIGILERKGARKNGEWVIKFNK